MHATVDAIAALQLPSGMIPWFPGGHSDPWNHVEAAMALDVAGRHAEAERAYEWLVDDAAARRRAGTTTTGPTAASRRTSSTPTSAPTSPPACGTTGCCTGDRGFLDDLWPAVERALDFVLVAADAATARSCGPARPTAPAVGLRAAHRLVEHPARPALRRSRSAELVGTSRARLGRRRRRDRRTSSPTGPSAFAPKDRWAMDWYYPVLDRRRSPARTAKARLADGWDTFVMEGLGVRCVSDEPWVTAAETAECALAYAAVGDRDTADRPAALDPRPPPRRRLVLDRHRLPRRRSRFPADEHTSYTAAAVILAADAIAGASPASALFTPRRCSTDAGEHGVVGGEVELVAVSPAAANHS